MEKDHPRFVPGDIVRVRQWEDMEKSYHGTDAGIHCPTEYDETGPYHCSFNREMQFLCGLEVHIKAALWLSDYELYAYHIEEYPDKYFVETMFERNKVKEQDLPELSDEEIKTYYSLSV